MKRRFIALILLLPIMTLLSIVYASTVQVDQGALTYVGGTGQLNVLGPGTINKINWIITGPPFKVEGITIEWSPEDANAQYDIYVEVYDQDGQTVVASGYTTDVSANGNTGSITTIINFGAPVDPIDIWYVNIIIVEK